MKFQLIFSILIIFISCSDQADTYFERQNDVGVFKNHALSGPTSNIHKIHAKELGIDCKKCHLGKSKNENNILTNKDACLNCHQEND